MMQLLFIRYIIRTGLYYCQASSELFFIITSTHKKNATALPFAATPLPTRLVKCLLEHLATDSPEQRRW